MPNSLADISDTYAVGIQPDGITFAIWGVIYSLTTVFTVYQALPGEWVPDRNDDLIFNQIGWLWSLNMILSSLWLPTFQSDTTIGFLGAELLCAVMLATSLQMDILAIGETLNWTE